MAGTSDDFCESRSRKGEGRAGAKRRTGVGVVASSADVDGGVRPDSAFEHDGSGRAPTVPPPPGPAAARPGHPRVGARGQAPPRKGGCCIACRWRDNWVAVEARGSRPGLIRQSLLPPGKCLLNAATHCERMENEADLARMPRPSTASRAGDHAACLQPPTSLSATGTTFATASKGEGRASTRIAASGNTRQEPGRNSKTAPARKAALDRRLPAISAEQKRLTSEDLTSLTAGSIDDGVSRAASKPEPGAEFLLQ
jgi:hypothetical protein